MAVNLYFPLPELLQKNLVRKEPQKCQLLCSGTEIKVFLSNCLSHKEGLRYQGQQLAKQLPLGLLSAVLGMLRCCWGCFRAHKVLCQGA